VEGMQRGHGVRVYADGHFVMRGDGGTEYEKQQRKKKEPECQSSSG